MLEDNRSPWIRGFLLAKISVSFLAPMIHYKQGLQKPILPTFRSMCDFMQKNSPTDIQSELCVVSHGFLLDNAL